MGAYVLVGKTGLKAREVEEVVEGVVGADPPEEVGEGEEACSLLFLASFVDLALSLPGGGFCSMPMLFSFSTFSGGVWIWMVGCDSCCCGVLICI